MTDESAVRYEPLEAAEARSILAEGLHTGWRKGVDHPAASRIHGEIARLPGDAWSDYIDWTISALESMGLKLCKEAPADGDVSYRVRYRELGGHVHAHFWSSEFGHKTTHGANGVLVFRRGKDWDEFAAKLSRAGVTLIDDTPESEAEPG